MKNLLKLFLAVLIIATMGFTAKADQKVSETQLPASAQSFLKKHYASVKVIECEKDGTKYDVELRGGIDLEFTADGKLLKIDAGSKKVPVAILKEILPQKAIDELKTRDVLGKVEEVELRHAAIKVELRQLLNDELRFDKDGNLLSVGD
ncbi:MAG: PepSY-like domain-containing protein [Muribaculaceae bacterium]|nr:PepSY-like domain-containing protein [Muribaculaceae bacterium]